MPADEAGTGPESARSAAASWKYEVEKICPGDLSKQRNRKIYHFQSEARRKQQGPGHAVRRADADVSVEIRLTPKKPGKASSLIFDIKATAFYFSERGPCPAQGP